ncbi:MAG: glycine--tRNA ligase subunit beta [bacterium]
MTSSTKKEVLLIEIGTEELPPKTLGRMMRSFAASFEQALIEAQFGFGSITSYATPRRLALKVSKLSNAQATQTTEKRGPSLKAAHDKDGNPSKAALGFMRSCGLDEMSKLETLETPKGAWLVYREEKPGAPLSELISGLIDKSLESLPIERKMRWGASRMEFVRPVHWLVALYGAEVLPANILGVRAGRHSMGHRFMSTGPVILKHSDDYEDALQHAHVVVNFEKRKQTIREQLENIASAIGSRVVIDDSLLDEVTALVEWPVALAGSFDPEFLTVPEEALISAMKSHQRYFHMVDGKNHLLPKFITVANIESKNPKVVVTGNERVIRPRLSDARFFYSQDKKSSLETKLSRLEDVVFHSKLGSYRNKVDRVSTLAGVIAGQLEADVEVAERAGLLCKSDLVSDMVNEFPELQGIMGGYYANHDGEKDSVGTAIANHYKPTSSGGDLPVTAESQSVAIADKLDTLTGLFGIGQPPSGSRDPFALRRQTLGVIRMCVENKLPLNIPDLLLRATELHNQGFDAKKTVAEVNTYLLERLGSWYQDSGVNVDTYSAVRQSSDPIANLADADLRVRTLETFRTHPQAVHLIAANKRIANILKKVDTGALVEVSAALFQEESERRLFATLEQTTELMNRTLNYEDKFLALAGLQTVIDSYFDDVMVMSNDEEQRNNRLATIYQVRTLFLSVADLSVLQ